MVNSGKSFAPVRGLWLISIMRAWIGGAEGEPVGECGDYGDGLLTSPSKITCYEMPTDSQPPAATLSDLPRHSC